MSEEATLLTTCFFKGKQYLLRMKVVRGNSLELVVVDKCSAEEWHCSCDSVFIENITHKTGNYKKFDIFITMLKSGILRTSECVSLDFLTFEELTHLRSRHIIKNDSETNSHQSTGSGKFAATLANRRYLILIYTVEFDRIYYSLPMEYVGPPSPQVLQSTIRRLEAQVQKLQDRLNNRGENTDIELWRKRIWELEAENWILQEEVTHLRELLSRQTSVVGRGFHNRTTKNIPVALHSLEQQVEKERASFKATLQGLQEQNYRLRKEIDDLRGNEESKSKPDSETFWRQHRGRSPTPQFSYHISPKMSVKHSNEPLFDHRMEQQERKQTLKEKMLRKAKSEGMFCKTQFDWEKTMPSHNKWGHKYTSSESSNHSRNRSPSSPYLQRQRYGTGLANCKNDELGKNNASCSKTSLSSGCASENKRKVLKKGFRSRHHSRTSSHSSLSSVTSCSSGSDGFHKVGRPQPAFQNPPRMLNRRCFRRGNSQPQKANCKLPLKKGIQKSQKVNDTKIGMLDLENRIKSLQKLLKEGLSLP